MGGNHDPRAQHEHRPITAVAFSPGWALATADEDGLILLWPPSALGARR